jgi:hypothetical protein
MFSFNTHRTALVALALISAAAFSPVSAGEGGGGGGGGEGGGFTMLPAPARGGAVGSTRNPYTGETRVVVRTPGAGTTITDHGADGKIVRQGRKPEPPPVARPRGPRPFLIYEKPVARGYSVRTYQNPDGSASNVTVDSEGREVGRTNFTGERADKVVADAQKARNAPPRTIIPTR